MVIQMGNPVIEYIIRILMAFLVGALIGLERERTRLHYLRSSDVEKRAFTLPGLRSFGLLSLYGMLIAYIQQNVPDPYVKSIVVIFMIIMIYSIFAIYIYRRTVMARTTGITTYIVMSISILLGFLVGLDRLLEAIATSILITLILAIKPSISRFVKEITYNELLSGLELGLLVFVLGPFFFLLQPVIYGIDLSKFYILFVIILALSYISYIAVRVKGSEALKYIAFLGGLVNSEAASSNIASIISRQKRLEEKDKDRLLRINLSLILIAMIIRNIIITLILVLPLYGIIDSFKIAGLLMLSLTIPILIVVNGLFLVREPYLENISVMIKNPLSYSTAFKVVIAYSVIFIISIVTSMFLPPEFLVLVAFIGGLVNAGATILSLITVSQLESFGIYFLTILIIMANIGASTNKLIFIRMVSREKTIILSTVKTIIYAILSNTIPLAVLLITT